MQFRADAIAFNIFSFNASGTFWASFIGLSRIPNPWRQQGPPTSIVSALEFHLMIRWDTSFQLFVGDASVVASCKGSD